MGHRLASVSLVPALLLCGSVKPAIRDDGLVDLLRLPAARPMTELTIAGEAQALPALLGGDTATVA
jgi:hypothetical protein